MMNWLLTSLIPALGIPLAYGAYWKVKTDCYRFQKIQEHDDLILERERQRIELENIRTVQADGNGLYPLVGDRSGVFRNPNSMRNWTVQTVLEAFPILERQDALQKLLLAARGVDFGNQFPAILESSTQLQQNWPEVVYLDELQTGSFALNDLILGVVPRPGGGYDPVRGNLADLIHVLIASKSGWGKSKLLQTLAYQLIRSRACHLALVDYGVNTFARMQDCQGLLYPVADTPDLAAALFVELNKEMQARKELYKDYPQVENLAQFNDASGEGLKPIVCLCDEGTLLVTRSGIKEPLTELLQQARKFGVWVILAGQNWKASILPTEIRDNFSSRIALHTSPPTSRIMIDSPDATSLPVPGRAIALLPGKQPITMHIPVVRNFDNLPKSNRPIEILKTGPALGGNFLEQVREAWEKTEGRKTVSGICRALGMRTGGQDFYDVRSAMKQIEAI